MIYNNAYRFGNIEEDIDVMPGGEITQINTTVDQ